MTEAAPVGTESAAVGIDVVSARPHRAKVVCWVAAVALVVVFTVVALSLRGGSEGAVVFGLGDQVAMVVLGLLGAGAVLWFTRPSVVADGSGIKVRNLLGSYDLSWDMVRHVRFARGDSWASLELVDDEIVAVMAVQAADKERAVEAIRGLRDLHRAALIR